MKRGSSGCIKLSVARGEKEMRGGRGNGGNYRRCLARTSKGGSRDGASAGDVWQSC